MSLSRRRFISIAAGAGAAALALGGAGPARARAGGGLRRWTGTAMGARAEMILPAAAMDLLPRLRAEIDRLEDVFSLYRPDSALSRLNRDGDLDAPPLELVDVLGRARAVSTLTDGAFDVTVQPLWALRARHLQAGTEPTPPEVAAARALVDWRGLRVDPARITLARRGMAVTLNGIAQGYVTDRVADVLRGAGLEGVLVSLGETRALGPHPDGRPWTVAPGADAEPLPLREGALAITEPAASGGHVLDPATGRAGGRLRRVTVQAPTATTADALSTALALVPAARRDAVARAGGATAVWALDV
ncbi:Nitrous oxide reductase maturation periplasmic protein NosX [Caenispirillum salinarum AK4]|uniref:FAD:protein FMN transferase n=1 Tax=Caenispirillum salinarum AK4 TaxID=1238182 RepID=K9GNS9_9PROT|nr:FAD:protein FMN transferase [Caenispirillum salinarum]EKV26379.1 Nitrous oxide reductase maturation periplasmic protein NosX [Caenispirillum salinarum AK4]